MSAIREYPNTRAMHFAVRPMKAADIPQSEDIERAAFPTMLPPTSFRRDLKNPRASYLVACRRGQATRNEGRTDPAPHAADGDGKRGLMGALVNSARTIWSERHARLETGREFIAGFLGTRYIRDEAHIVSLGVRGIYRGQGIGELLLIAAIEQAMARRSEVVRLEVRPSNAVARNLYLKYGFRERGVRKGYYADDREDAIIMTTDPILLAPYPGLFQKLEREHQRRWGRAERATLVG
jgi:ribosomal-protein-alanine N-acetyltransferase